MLACTRGAGFTTVFDTDVGPRPFVSVSLSTVKQCPAFQNAEALGLWDPVYPKGLNTPESSHSETYLCSGHFPV